MEKDLKWIKKHYGEELMHMCREMFPRLLEKEGLLPNLLETHFTHNKHLAEDINKENKKYDFKDYIFSLVDVEKEELYANSTKSASELMDEAGYILYPECKSEKDIQSFKKYYKSGEELCTFNGGRLNSCRVWFAVKKDVENIKRENFTNPTRQDEYGTSVISIQFSRHHSTLSIKNRYNHTVNNPDNTFNSDLDNIIHGLTNAFEHDFGVKDDTNRKIKFELNNYIQLNNKFYHYNYEINNIYYCDNNVVVDNFQLNQLSNSKMLIDYFIVDFKNKNVSIYDEKIHDSFPEIFTNIDKINYNNGVITITQKDNSKTELGINDRRQIVSLSDENLKTCEDSFLFYNRYLNDLKLPALTECGDDFMCGNQYLTKLNLPALIECDNNFLYLNINLKELNLPALQKCGKNFLYSNKKLAALNSPALTECGNGFLYNNKNLKELNLPALQKCRYGFLFYNSDLKDLNLPALIECGNNFLYHNINLKELNLPALQKHGKDFLYKIKSLSKYESNDNLNF